MDDKSKGFADHFAAVASAYAGFRPTYPWVLYAWLASIAPGRALAWDCGCGSGQATVDLAQYFDRIVATDASAAQIAAAPSHAKIEFRVAPAETSGLEPNSVDLITVAQALHWFDLDGFYVEARRVLNPGGILAAWTYGVVMVEGDEANARVQAFYKDTIGPYWPPERRHVESGYRTLPFPFDEIAAPAFRMEAFWTLAEFAGYLRSWSATAQFVKAHGYDPVAELERDLTPHWGDEAKHRRIAWPLSLRVARVMPQAASPA